MLDFIIKHTYDSTTYYIRYAFKKYHIPYSWFKNYYAFEGTEKLQ